MTIKDRLAKLEARAVADANQVIWIVGMLVGGPTGSGRQLTGNEVGIKKNRTGIPVIGVSHEIWNDPDKRAAVIARFGNPSVVIPDNGRDGFRFDVVELE